MSSVKWMSSKMRLIQKMSNNPQMVALTTLIDHNYDSHNIINSTTTSTISVLWLGFVQIVTQLVPHFGGAVLEVLR